MQKFRNPARRNSQPPRKTIIHPRISSNRLIINSTQLPQFSKENQYKIRSIDKQLEAKHILIEVDHNDQMESRVNEMQCDNTKNIQSLKRQHKKLQQLIIDGWFQQQLYNQEDPYSIPNLKIPTVRYHAPQRVSKTVCANRHNAIRSQQDFPQHQKLNTIVKLKSILKKLQSPQKRDRVKHLQTQQAHKQNYLQEKQSFIEEYYKKRRATLKVEDIMKLKNQIGSWKITTDLRQGHFKQGFKIQRTKKRPSTMSINHREKGSNQLFH